MKDLMFETHYDRLCDLIDANQNKVIDFKEFKKMYPVAASTFFQQLDANSDDVLSRDELKSMFVLADGTMDFERVAQILADVEEKLANQKKEADAAIDAFFKEEEKQKENETKAVVEEAKSETKEEQKPSESSDAGKAQSKPAESRDPEEIPMDDKTKPSGCCIIS